MKKSLKSADFMLTEVILEFDKITDCDSAVYHMDLKSSARLFSRLWDALKIIPKFET
jgi:hypothetical protein